MEWPRQNNLELYDMVGEVDVTQDRGMRLAVARKQSRQLIFLYSRCSPANDSTSPSLEWSEFKTMTPDMLRRAIGQFASWMLVGRCRVIAVAGLASGNAPETHFCITFH